MKNELISIIIPTYNASKYIATTIKSVVSQTYKNWELIIIDDYSTDNTEQIVATFVEEYPQIFYEKLKINSGGPSTPRNRGLQLAKGDYIAFLDSDDIWHYQKLEYQLNYMKAKGVEFCFTDVQPFTDETRIGKNNINSSFNVVSLNHKMLLRKNFIKSGSSVLCKKSIIDGVVFNEEKKYIAIEDYLFWLQVHQRNNLQSAWIKEKFVFYRLSESSISKSKIAMFKKNMILYSEYEISGKNLGFKKYYYLLTYIYFSFHYLIKNKLNS